MSFTNGICLDMFHIRVNVELDLGQNKDVVQKQQTIQGFVYYCVEIIATTKFP